MAEAFLNEICGDEFEAHSAGIEPGKLNPIVVEAMREIGMIFPATNQVGGRRYQIQQDFCLCHHRLRRGERGTLPDFSRQHEAIALGLSRPVQFSRHARRKAGQNPRSARRHQEKSSAVVRGSLSDCNGLEPANSKLQHPEKHQSKISKFTAEFFRCLAL